MPANTSPDSTQQLILFSDKRPDAIGLSQLYDPDLHGTDPTASGKIVPAINSLVVDESTSILYYVASQSTTTWKSTLKPVKYLIQTGTDEDDIPTVVDYGNSRFMLYFDDRTRPTELNIDARLYFFNLHSVEYRLVRKLPNNEVEVISLYLDSDGTFKGNRIPLATVQGLAVITKYCTNCHTLVPLTDGETIIVQLFDTNGVLTMEVPLIVKRPDALNDLASDSNPIIKFDADATQMMGEGFYLYENQSPSALHIRPYVQLSDGIEKTYPIDNKTCFLYGLERDGISSYPGRKYKVMIKKFLSTREMSSISTYDPTLKSITVEKWITIVKNETNYSMKLSIIPWYDGHTTSYKFVFLAYTEEGDHVFDVTEHITIPDTFDPRKFDVEQHLKIVFDSDVIFHKGIVTHYQQSWWITLRQPNVYEQYLIKDSQSDEYAFGVDVSTRRRPIIHYDPLIKQYFIPTSVFRNISAMLESFYYVARPPFDPKIESGPTRPTHFTIRAMDDTNVLISVPIPITEFNQAWNIVRPGDPAQLVGGTVIVEFLNKIGEEYKLLYGVPAKIRESTTGYNNEGNIIP